LVHKEPVASAGRAPAESDPWISGGDVGEGRRRRLPDPPLWGEPVAGEVDVQDAVVLRQVHVGRVAPQQRTDGLGATW